MKLICRTISPTEFVYEACTVMNTTKMLDDGEKCAFFVDSVDIIHGGECSYIKHYKKGYTTKVVLTNFRHLACKNKGGAEQNVPGMPSILICSCSGNPKCPR